MHALNIIINFFLTILFSIFIYQKIYQSQNQNQNFFPQKHELPPETDFTTVAILVSVNVINLIQKPQEE